MDVKREKEEKRKEKRSKEWKIFFANDGNGQFIESKVVYGS